MCDIYGFRLLDLCGLWLWAWRCECIGLLELMNNQSVNKYDLSAKCLRFSIPQWRHHQERDNGYSTVLWPNEDKWRQLFFFFFTWWCLNLPFLILYCDIKSCTFYSIFTMLNDTEKVYQNSSKHCWKRNPLSAFSLLHTSISWAAG